MPGPPMTPNHRRFLKLVASALVADQAFAGEAGPPQQITSKFKELEKKSKLMVMVRQVTP